MPAPFHNVTLSKAFGELAAEDETQIALGPGVGTEGKVNGRLELQPLSTALRLLLLALNRKVRRDGPVYVIEKPVTTPAPALLADSQAGVPPTGPKPASWPDYIQWPPDH